MFDTKQMITEGYEVVAPKLVQMICLDFVLLPKTFRNLVTA